MSGPQTSLQSGRGVLSISGSSTTPHAWASRLSVTRASLTQAFARVRESGPVETKHGAGALVRDHKRLGGLALLPVLVTANVPGWLKEIFEVRRDVGALVVAERLTPGIDAVTAKDVDAAHSHSLAYMAVTERMTIGRLSNDDSHPRDDVQRGHSRNRATTRRLR